MFEVDLLDFIQTLAAFIVALGLLIFVHEYGHFWVARRCGVRVLKFSIGFGKSLVSWRDKQGTEFVVSALPLGGFVKMLGESGTDVSESEKAYSFAHKTVWQRFAIVAAGPLVNLAFAVALYWCLFLTGVTSLAPYVGKVEAGSLAAEAGFQPMDEILQVDGKAVETWDDVTLALVARIGETGEISLLVRPENSTQPHAIRLEVSQWMSGQEKVYPLTVLGIEPFFPEVPPVLGDLVAGKAAQRQGLQPDDRILQVNDVAIATWDEWVQLIRDNPGIAMDVRVLRGEQPIDLVITPDTLVGEDGNSVGQIGAHLQSALAKYPDFMIREQRYGPLRSMTKAVDHAWSRIALTFASIGKMITGLISVENLSGPITIAKIAGVSAQYGLESFLSFLAYLSISLGVLNLLPVPVLDGGHLMYYLVEIIKGSPVSEKAQAFGNSIGLGLLVMFMGLAFYNDFMGL